MLLGGRQGKMFKEEIIALPEIHIERVFKPARSFALSPIQLQNHAEFINSINNSLWHETAAAE